MGEHPRGAALDEDVMRLRRRRASGAKLPAQLGELQIRGAALVMLRRIRREQHDAARRVLDRGVELMQRSHGVALRQLEQGVRNN